MFTAFVDTVLPLGLVPHVLFYYFSVPSSFAFWILASICDSILVYAMATGVCAGYWHYTIRLANNESMAKGSWEQHDQPLR